MFQKSMLNSIRQDQSQEKRDKILEPYLGKRQTTAQPELVKKTKVVPQSSANR